MDRTKNNRDGKKWKLVSRRQVFSALPWMTIYVDAVQLPSGRVVDDYYLIEAPDYAMICATDDDGRLLLERQYKHAIGQFTLCLPAGCVDPGESPFEAARREFLEETGYVAREWFTMGSFTVDVNRGCGRGHFFHAKGISSLKPPVKDDMEDPDILFFTPEEVRKAIAGGQIQSLSSVALLCLTMQEAGGTTLGKSALQELEPCNP